MKLVANVLLVIVFLASAAMFANYAAQGPYERWVILDDSEDSQFIHSYAQGETSGHQIVFHSLPEVKEFGITEAPCVAIVRRPPFGQPVIEGHTGKLKSWFEYRTWEYQRFYKRLSER